MQFNQTPVTILGVPMDLGQNRRGVDMGPSAIRYAGLQRRLEALGLTVRDIGNIEAPVIEQVEQQADEDRAHNAREIAAVCQRVYEQARQAAAAGHRVVALGGDHSISLGTGAAALTRAEKVGVLWVDAHGDFNTPEITPSGNVHGMVAAALMGRCPPPLRIGDRLLDSDHLVMLGVRDLDVAEKAALRQARVRVITMREVDERGIAAAMQTAFEHFHDVEAIHVSFDMDSLDPSTAPGVGTPVSGGLTAREAHLVMELLADDARVCSLDLVEVNPILDERNRTAIAAVDFAAGLFGQRIL